jgi:glucokinase
MSGEARALGIDIGGTKIAVAAVRASGEIDALETVPTESQRGFASGVERIREAAQRVLDRCGWSIRELAGIGVGCAGPVDPVRGTVDNPYTLPGWEGGNLVAALRESFSCSVRLENDADTALLGECWVGAGRGQDPVVMLTFGTGIGGAALVSGALLRGAMGAHPELGHVVVDSTGPRCYCGEDGCFEALASGSALNAEAAAHGLGDARQLLARAAAGEVKARRLRERALAATARATSTLLHTLLPARFVLGGGMMDEHYEPFAEAVAGAIARAAFIPPGRVSVARAELGNRAGLVGAARSVLACLETGSRDGEAMVS